MDRRTFIQYSAASIVLTACGNPSTPPPVPVKNNQNVLFIAVDDLNTWIGCLKGIREGVPTAHTPNIDRLASQGVLFNNAHTPVPWCMPARNNLFAGLYANQSGMFNTEYLRDALPDVKTIPQHFMQYGYQTMAAGKLFHDASQGADSWQEFEPFERMGIQKPQTPQLNQMAKAVENDGFDWGQIALPNTEFTDVKIADWVIARLQHQYVQPFFLAAGFRFPHLPWYLPKEFLDMYPLDQINLPWVKDDDLDDLPQKGKELAYRHPVTGKTDFENSDHYHVVDGGVWKKAVQAYLAAITFVDRQIGRVLDALDQSEYYKNTIVVLWSDNGFHLGEKLHWRKFTLWDQATRVPMMLRAPQGVLAGRKIDQAVSLVDIYPTLVEMCGLPLPAHKLAGDSLVSLLAGEKEHSGRPVFTTFGKGNDSVVDGRWRYIRYEDGAEELYDHHTDPHEWENLAERVELQQEKKRLMAFLPVSKAP